MTFIPNDCLNFWCLHITQYDGLTKIILCAIAYTFVSYFSPILNSVWLRKAEFYNKTTSTINSYTFKTGIFGPMLEEEEYIIFSRRWMMDYYSVSRKIMSYIIFCKKGWDCGYNSERNLKIFFLIYFFLFTIGRMKGLLIFFFFFDFLAITTQPYI